MIQPYLFLPRCSPSLIASVPAEVPETLAGGAQARFKVVYDGPGAEGVTRFKVKLSKD